MITNTTVTTIPKLTKTNGSKYTTYQNNVMIDVHMMLMCAVLDQIKESPIIHRLAANNMHDCSMCHDQYCTRPNDCMWYF